MKRRFASAVLGIVCLVWSVLSVAPATAREPDPVADGSKYIGACLQSARSLSALFVFDRSGSLSFTDPRGIRYEGLETALRQLGQLTRADGQPLSVEVAIAGFDGQYDEAKSIVDWRSLNDDPVTQDREISDIIKRAKSGTAPRGGTDFEKPLVGGLAEFSDRKTANSCRLMFWFTDGEFEYNPLGVDAARAKLCTPGGVVDQLRQSGIVIIGLQLGTQTRDLKPMALGEASGTQCGTQPLPEGWAPGIYLQADDDAKLKRIFGRLNDIVLGCTPAGSSGVIDPGIHRMRVTIDTPQLSNTVRFDAPSGANFVAGTHGETNEVGYRVQSVRDDHFVFMDVTFPMDARPGQWRITPDVPVQPADISFCLFSDLRLEKPTALPTQSGTNAVVTIPVVDRDGNPADLSVYKAVTPAVSVLADGGVPRPATATVDPGGQISVEIQSEPTDARVDISLRVHLVTVSDLALAPLAINFGQALVLPGAFPLVEPRDVLDLGKTVKKRPASADLALMGSPDGETQVCFDAPVRVVVPDDAVGTTLTYPVGCLVLATGESRTVQVSVTPVASAVGDGEGAIPVRLVSAPTLDGQTQTATFDLPAVWRFTNPTNYLVTIFVATIVGLLSALVPLLAIGLAGWAAAKYDLRGLQATAFDVLVSHDSVRRTEPIKGRPGGLVDVTELGPVPGGDGSRRSFQFDGVEFKSKASALPARAPRFWAEALPGRAMLAGPGQPGDADDGSSVTTTPGLGFLALLSCSVTDLRDQAGREIPGRLVVLTKSRDFDDARLDARVRGLLAVDSFRQHHRDLGPVEDGPSPDSDHFIPPTDLLADDLWD